MQDEAFIQITNILKEYQTLFPLNGIERKGMVEDIDRMKIPLRLQTNPTQQQLSARHYQYIKVKPSIEGRLILHYDSRVFAHPNLLKETWLRP